MKKFILSFFASIVANLSAMFIFFIFLPIALVVSVAYYAMSSGVVAMQECDASSIVINFSEPISDICQTENPLSNYLDGATPITTRSICARIENAKNDESNKVIFLCGSFADAFESPSYAQISEIRNALSNYAKSGKKIVAYLENPNVRDYFLASCASKIYLNPMSDFTFNGLGGNSMFFGGALKKYGVEATVVKVGKRKSFGEMFTAEKMSDDVRKNYVELLNSVWDSLLAKISNSRKISTEDLSKIANDRAMLNADEAKTLKLVDTLATRDEVVEEMKKLVGKGETSFAQTSIFDYSESDNEVIPEKNIAVVYMNGDIMEGSPSRNSISPSVYCDVIRTARDDKSVSAMVVRINSGGGDAFASERIRRELELFAKQKPLVVSVGATAASGAYWIATAAQKIFADETSVTGSIGVFSLMFSAEKFAKDFGVTFDSVKTSPMADIGTIARAPTQTEIARMENLTRNVYNRFITLVSASRKIPLNEVETFADGGVFSGKKAKEMKLVDEIGGINAAVARAKILAKTPDAGVDELPKRDAVAEFISNFTPSVGGEFVKIKTFKPIVESLKRFKHFSSGVYARAPFDFFIE